MLGVVGDDGTARRLVDRLRDAGAEVVTGGPDGVVDRGPDAVVAVGEDALVDLVWSGVDAPLLTVGTGRGLPAVSPDAAPAAVDALLGGDVDTRDHRLLAVEVEGEAIGPAALDVLLVRSQPGRISEYRLDADGTRSRFRADGVVAATPAGSHGYAHDAGGPRLAPGTDAVAVVPVAAFGLGAPAWVVDPGGGLSLSVERDEGEVSLLLDGRERRRLAGQSLVALTRGGTLRTVVPLDGRAADGRPA